MPLPPNDDHPEGQADDYAADCAADQAEPPAPDRLGSDQVLLARLARAADLCLQPHRHAVRLGADSGAGSRPAMAVDWSDCCLLIEARDAAGCRQPRADLELEIYRSGPNLNLMLTRIQDPHAPLLWFGSHPVWMRGASGERCDRPADGAPLEAFCRRVRALLPGP